MTNLTDAKILSKALNKTLEQYQIELTNKGKSFSVSHASIITGLAYAIRDQLYNYHAIMKVLREFENGELNKDDRVNRYIEICAMNSEEIDNLTKHILTSCSNFIKNDVSFSKMT